MQETLNNPFVIIGDIPEPYFCDREVETQQIIRTLTNEGNIVLMSPRRMGKSRLVKHVFKQPQISEHYQTFYIDGPEKDKIAAIIQENEIGERIIMYGARYGKELKEFFEKDDVFLLPGTGGLAINEAMAYSMPVISTVGDDTVVDLSDGNGILLNNFGDKDEIEKAIKTFLDLPEADKRTMSQKSEQIVKERASLNNMANQHVKAIEHVLKE